MTTKKLPSSEKAMATHSSTLAWKIPWTEEPGRLQSMGSWRVAHDWATSLSCIGEGNGNPLQCSCLENPRDGRAWWAAIYRWPPENFGWISTHQCSFCKCSSSTKSWRLFILPSQLFGCHDFKGQCEENLNLEKCFSKCGSMTRCEASKLLAPIHVLFEILWYLQKDYTITVRSVMSFPRWPSPL